ncbi:MAG: sugar phosphate isomerase/epimerase and 4-hydroxyphenylpyruvate domain-containing protein [Rhizobiales bacterium]|nr:sugar phosphate isomerase/epimerase and 4-hydroxyphenylpyruvate domain-containing protein [Hyphomicrobiales bacterium]
MKTCIATVSLSGSLREKLEAIARAGFAGVEIFEGDFLGSDESPRNAGRMIRDLGLEIMLFQPFRDFEAMPEPQRRRGFERAARKFELMNELGVDLILVCSNTSPVSLGGIDRAAADLRELGDLAETAGVRVGYEALAWGRHIRDHRDAWEIVRRADHPRIGLILDSFHTLAPKIEVDSIRAIPGDRLFFVQLADAPQIEMDVLQRSRHLRNMPGEGDLPVVDFMRAVCATGYDRAISLEIFNDQFRAGPPNQVAIDGHRSLLNLMDQVRRAEPALELAGPAIPPPARTKGVAFVEFAADPAESAALVGILRSFGFRRTGRHKTKDVDLFAQGDIRIVVNRESEGLAGSTRHVRGTSAYAFGLAVEDAAATLARAQALDGERFKEMIAPGRLDIPAVRGLGGGLIYFLDGRTLPAVWSAEFDPVEDAGGAPGGLLAVDHLAQSMTYDEMPSWVLFYTSLLDALKKPEVDIVDPSGLVRSRVVESSDASLRITMNGTENYRTLAGRFLRESFGSGIQHIAFSTGDIFAAMAAFKASGFRPLAISPNYYDDVESRFGLDPAFADRLRADNILYDRSETGEYFQFYSPTLGDTFFFEVVERRNYDGYGGPNAPFRIAAQKRRLQSSGTEAY